VLDCRDWKKLELFMVKITFKLATGSKFDMDVEGSMTVATLKDLIADLANVPPPNQRMVFKGQVRHIGSSIVADVFDLASNMNICHRFSKTPTLPTATAWSTATLFTLSPSQLPQAKPPLPLLLPPLLLPPSLPLLHNPQILSQLCLATILL
jgi:hypothetical protein